ncbi:MAG: hypothetical protein ACRDSP_15340 [Pseudonocardiaceae bacterium]
MNDFFGELAKQLAGRWLSLLAIPGVLFLAAGWAGLQLGQHNALDPHQLAGAVRTGAAEIASRPAGTQILAAVGVLLAAVIVGLIVQALVGPVRTFCLGVWPGPLRRLGRLLTSRRRHHWKDLHSERAALEKVHPQPDRTTEQQRRIDDLTGRTNKIAMAEPARPTWMGDRIHALSDVAIHRHGLDMAFGWPRLWLVLPDSARAEINSTQGGLATDLFTVAWALPYLALGALWWPAAAIGVVIGLVGWSRARSRITVLTELAESALDVHGRDLAIIFGVADPTSTGPLTPDEGKQITEIARKGR